MIYPLKIKISFSYICFVVITEAHALCKSIVEGDYEAVLTHPLSQRILDPGEDPSKQLEDIIIDNVSKAVAEENSPNISER